MNIGITMMYMIGLPLLGLLGAIFLDKYFDNVIDEGIKEYWRNHEQD